MIEKLSTTISDNLTLKEIKRELELLGFKEEIKYNKMELAIMLATILLYKKKGENK